jgi:large subunit ribosomal protein L5
VLAELYKDTVCNDLKEKFGYSSIMAVPAVSKVCVNVGFGSRDQKEKDAGLADNIAYNLAMVTGQRPMFTRARQSIAGFKVREGQIIGCAATIRSQRMWHFLERTLFYGLTRTRDFRGFSNKQMDGNGNLNFSLPEVSVFPEINYDKLTFKFGVGISVITTARNDEEGRALLSMLLFPFND